LDVRRSVGDEIGLAFVTISLGSLHASFGDPEIARERIKEGFVLSRRIGLSLGLVVSHMLAGEMALKEGRLDDARAHFAAGLNLELSANNQQYRAQILRRAGALALKMGKYDEAEKHHTEALELFLDLGDQRAQAQAYIDLGDDGLALGNFSAALSNFLRAV